MSRMLLAIILLPLAAAAPLKDSPDFSPQIENGILKGVRPTGSVPTNDLDLSGLDLQGIDKAAFDDVRNLRSLSLASNSLTSLPEFVFSNLTSLESLSLANNQIRELKNLFVGLDNLKMLNLSNNPIDHLRRSQLFGLSSSCDICTEGNVFWSISTGAFTNAFLKDEEGTKDSDEKTVERYEDLVKNADAPSHNIVSAYGLKKPRPSINKNVRVKLCMANGEVASLETFAQDADLTNGCTEVSVDTAINQVSLRNLGIRSFQEGWYKLASVPIASIDLSNNEISEITKETLNGLPAGLIYVNFLENRIRRIWSQVIENEHLRMLNFKNNQIEVIEDGAFQSTKLSALFLTGNPLDNLNFVATLPQTITEFVATGNRLTSIPTGVFANLPKLVYLNLGHNQIEKIPSRVFEGLESLQVLVLTRNKISEIEPNAFAGLKAVTIFYAYQNKLTNLRSDTFKGLDNLKDLNLAWNNLTAITKEVFNGLPSTLENLHLDDNQIRTIEPQSFQQVPKHTLSLNNNRIANIPQGAFNLPTLRDLHLKGNKLESIDGNSFEGLPNLKHLYLSENLITSIKKGACKNFGSLNILDISRNPFERLENGALYGMSTAKGTFLYVYENHIKLIQGGVFDDI